MLSFIVCSVDERKLSNLRANIQATIDVEFEIVAIDNLDARYSICQAYNIGAAQAKYPYLCFAHEDIEFLDKNWAQSIIEQLAISMTGVIGFAGATGKTAVYSPWSFIESYHRFNMRQNNCGVVSEMISNPSGERFSQVITLDGLCLFVRADVWAQVHFDEVTFDGFHLYDLDFTTAVVVAGYRNYVCNTCMVEHFSGGSFDKVWMSYSKKYHEKWANHLPLYVEPQSDKKIRKIERVIHRRMAYYIVKRSLLSPEQTKELVGRNMRLFPFRPDSYLLWLKMGKISKK